MTTKNYTDSALTDTQLLERLNLKGLVIPDKEHAALCLKTVGYHRLSAYFDTFKNSHSSNWKFTPNIDFETIWQLYIFDRELRLLVIDALERIEIAFRCSLSNTLSLQYGAHWYLNATLFKNENLHKIFLQKMDEVCKREQDTHIKRYYNDYCHPKFPPSWIVMEYLPFGACTSAFRNLKNLRDKKSVCEVFGFHPTAIESWLEALRYTRNLCAHHARLWNRWFVVSPKLAYLYGDSFNKEHTFLAQAIVIHRLLQTISPGSNWLLKLHKLFNEHSFVPIVEMGFELHWNGQNI